jgi:hypothetical protein
MHVCMYICPLWSYTSVNLINLCLLFVGFSQSMLPSLLAVIIIPCLRNICICIVLSTGRTNRILYLLPPSVFLVHGYCWCLFVCCNYSYCYCYTIATSSIFSKTQQIKSYLELVVMQVSTVQHLRPVGYR